MGTLQMIQIIMVWFCIITLFWLTLFTFILKIYQFKRQDFKKIVYQNKYLGAKIKRIAELYKKYNIPVVDMIYTLPKLQTAPRIKTQSSRPHTLFNFDLALSTSSLLV